MEISDKDLETIYYVLCTEYNPLTSDDYHKILSEKNKIKEEYSKLKSQGLDFSTCAKITKISWLKEFINGSM